MSCRPVGSGGYRRAGECGQSFVSLEILDAVSLIYDAGTAGGKFGIGFGFVYLRYVYTV
jgi:hypothetical protein